MREFIDWLMCDDNFKKLLYAYIAAQIGLQGFNTMQPNVPIQVQSEVAQIDSRLARIEKLIDRMLFERKPYEK